MRVCDHAPVAFHPELQIICDHGELRIGLWRAQENHVGVPDFVPRQHVSSGRGHLPARGSEDARNIEAA
jgi:hypothetical protein